MRRNTNDMIVTAKKTYKCDLCGRIIKPGNDYRRINRNFEGIFHYCMKCENRNNDKFLYEISVKEDDGELTEEDILNEITECSSNGY